MGTVRGSSSVRLGVSLQPNRSSLGGNVGHAATGADLLSQLRASIKSLVRGVGEGLEDNVASCCWLRTLESLPPVEEREIRQDQREILFCEAIKSSHRGV